jgi:hypothetical protein
MPFWIDPFIHPMFTFSGGALLRCVKETTDAADAHRRQRHLSRAAAACGNAVKKPGWSLH